MELIKSVYTKFVINLDKNVIHIFCLLVAILLFLIITIVLPSLHSRTIAMPLLSIISLWISRNYIAIKKHMFVGRLNMASTAHTVFKVFCLNVALIWKVS